MTECYSCGKKGRINEDWRVDRGFFSIYYTCPNCLNKLNLKKGYTDLRVTK